MYKERGADIVRPLCKYYSTDLAKSQILGEWEKFILWVEKFISWNEVSRDRGSDLVKMHKYQNGGGGVFVQV